MSQKTHTNGEEVMTTSQLVVAALSTLDQLRQRAEETLDRLEEAIADIIRNPLNRKEEG